MVFNPRSGKLGTLNEVVDDDDDDDDEDEDDEDEDDDVRCTKTYFININSGQT